MNSEPMALSAAQRASADPLVGPASGAGTFNPPPKSEHWERDEGLNDPMKAELGRARREIDFLREENRWLRSKVIGMNEALTDANQTIYSLNRKLDAIFKPGTEEGQTF